MAAKYTLSNTVNSTLTIAIPPKSVQFSCRINLVNKEDVILVKGSNDNIIFFSLDAHQRGNEDDEDFINKNGEYYISLSGSTHLRFEILKKGTDDGTITIEGYFSNIQNNYKNNSAVVIEAVIDEKNDYLNTNIGDTHSVKMGYDGGILIGGSELREIRNLLKSIRNELSKITFHMTLLTGEVANVSNLAPDDD